MALSRKEWFDWAVRGAAVVLLLVLVWSWNSGRQAKEDLSKELERVKLEKAALLVQVDASKREMSQREKDLLMANADLEVEVDRLKHTVGTVKVIEVVKWRTVTVEVEKPGAPRECTPGKAVLLQEGDTGHAEVSELTYETKEGNHVVIGKASCFRDTPTTQRLFSSVIEAPISIAVQLQAPPEKRWGAGAYMGFSKDGWAVGPALAFPPLHVWSTQLELNAGLGIGPDGQFQGGLLGVVR